MVYPLCLWLWPAEVTVWVQWCRGIQLIPSSTAHLSLQTGVHRMCGHPSVCQVVSIALSVFCAELLDTCHFILRYWVFLLFFHWRSWLLHHPLPRGCCPVCGADLWPDGPPGVVQAQGLNAQHLGVSQAGRQEATGLQPLIGTQDPVEPSVLHRLSAMSLFTMEIPLTVDVNLHVLSHTWIIPLRD